MSMTNWRVVIPIVFFVLGVGPFLYAIFYPALTGTSPQEAAKEAFTFFYLLSPFITVIFWVAIGYVIYRKFFQPRRTNQTADP